MSEWRDIASAPKDGTVVLLYCPEGVDRSEYEWRDLHFTMGYYSAGGRHVPGRWLSTETITSVHDYGGMTGACSETEVIKVKPTHWKPLDPPAPAQLEPEGNGE